MTRTLAELRRSPHLSVSQLKTFIQCPRKYALSHVDGVAPMFRPIALAFGTAWHEAIGHHLTSSTSGTPADRDEVKTIFRERLAIAVEDDATPVLFDEDDDLGKTIDQGLRMLAAFLEHVALPEAVLGVEVPFSMDLRDPSDGGVLPLPLVGAFDAIVLESGVHVVWELKTSKKKWSGDQLEFDLQPTAYAMASEELGYGDPEVVLLVTTKTKTPDVQVERLRRHRGDHADLAATAASVMRAVSAGVDHPIRGWQCRGCAVAHACT